MSAALQVSHDIPHLNKLLDITKTLVFKGNNASFFAPLMCSMDFHWREDVDTAATDGTAIWWSPSYFLSLPPQSRKTDLMHELWHVARLHMIRIGSRNKKLWNIACDIRIDLDLLEEGYTFDNIKGVLTWPNLDARRYAVPWTDAAGQPQVWVEEAIYDDLVKRGFTPPPNYAGSLRPGDKVKQSQTVNAVVRAMHQSALGGGAGTVPGSVKSIIEKFLAPIIPWERLLHQFIQDLIVGGWTWGRPNRRYTTMYMPSRYEEEGALTHLVYIEDVSGSISDADILRFNSELKYVKETYQPKKMTVLQFDTTIQSERVFLDSDSFERIEIVGRGGTDLRPVHEWIVKHRPTAAVIFSDLQCAPMEPLPFEIPVIWVCISNKAATVPFGKIIHIN